MNLKNVISEEIDKLTGEGQYAYHVTRRANLPSIKSKGLEPKVPEDFGPEGDIKGVYLFKTYDDMINALYNWLGERIDEWEEETGEDYDEIALKIDMTKIDPNDIQDTVEYEWTVTETIPPEAIIGVLNV
jgi:hypothetical protein